MRKGTHEPALEKQGEGYGVVLADSRRFALGGDGAPVFIGYRYAQACKFKRDLAEHGMKGKVVRVEWTVREVPR